MASPPKTPWIHCPRPNASARLRLFCFPFAGAGASVYFPWAADLSPNVELCAIQLPGRENRLREPLLHSLEPATRALADAIAPWLHAPFAFYGHSLGALIAFDLTRELRRRRAPLPAQLLISGRRAPHLVDDDPLHRLSETAFLDRIRKMEGTPPAVLQEPELMELFLPILRADLAINESYRHMAEPPLELPISAFGGRSDDRATQEQIDAWRTHTVGSFSLEMFPGGHFFIKSERAAVLRSISHALRDIVHA